VDPNTLASYGIPCPRSRRPSCAPTTTWRAGDRACRNGIYGPGLGYIKSIEDVQNIVVGANRNGTPVMVRISASSAWTRTAPGPGRGQRQGEVVGGIVVARFGANARAVIEGVKAKLDELKSGLPPG